MPKEAQKAESGVTVKLSQKVVKLNFITKTTIEIIANGDIHREDACLLKEAIFKILHERDAKINFLIDLNN